METIQKGKQTNKQTNNMCINNKGKQTNKQTSRGSTCGGTDAGGGAELHSMWSLIHNASEYMEELQSCFGDASEKCGVQCTGSYSDIMLFIFIWNVASKLHSPKNIKNGLNN